MELWFATTHLGKLREAREILGKERVTLKSLKEIGVYTPPEETGKTFLENAQIKAMSLRTIKNTSWVMADDSGLEVKALNGAPGIYSARYAGPSASDAENVSKLMMSLKDVPDRSAQFVCCLCVINPKGQEYSFEGVLKGRIAEKVSGTSGFGYDPVFIPEGGTRTFAEMSPEEKNKISHRSIALAKFRKSIFPTSAN